MKKIAIILSGSGVFDGSEIYESTLTFLAIEHNGGTYQCFAPDIPQAKVVNHLTGETMTDQSRNVLVEAARLCRGNIKALTTLNIDDFDGLILPGGFGAAASLSDFAAKGVDCTINDQVLAVCKAFAAAKKPAGYICIAPVLIPLIYPAGVQCTIGNAPDTAGQINAMGGEHIDCEAEEFVVDLVHRVVSTPAFMLANSITEAQMGIDNLVTELISMCD